MDAPGVSHGTAADQVFREITYLATKLAIAQEAKSQGKTKTEKTDESCHASTRLKS